MHQALCVLVLNQRRSENSATALYAEDSLHGANKTSKRETEKSMM